MRNMNVNVLTSGPDFLHLFDVEEVLGIKGDAGAGHGDVLV